MLALTTPTSGARLIGIVRSQTKATELLLSLVIIVTPQHSLVFIGGMKFKHAYRGTSFHKIAYAKHGVAPQHGIPEDFICHSKGGLNIEEKR
jgi:hypothetical protein